MAGTDNNPRCRLLELSAELRNTIYRHTLVQDAPIHVTDAGYDRGGGLLGTCKQIRSEALGIYYCENYFKVEQKQCNSDNLLKLVDGARRMGISGRRINSERHMKILEEPNWTILLVWLERYHSGHIQSPVSSFKTIKSRQCNHAKRFVVAGMCEMVFHMERNLGRKFRFS